METKEKKNKTDRSVQLWPASREAINKYQHSCLTTLL